MLKLLTYNYTLKYLNFFFKDDLNQIFLMLRKAIVLYDK